MSAQLFSDRWERRRRCAHQFDRETLPNPLCPPDRRGQPRLGYPLLMMKTNAYYFAGSSSFFPAKAGRIVGVRWFSPAAAAAATVVLYVGNLEARVIQQVTGSSPGYEHASAGRFEGAISETFDDNALSVPITEKTLITVVQDAVGTVRILVEE